MKKEGLQGVREVGGEEEKTFLNRETVCRVYCGNISEQFGTVLDNPIMFVSQTHFCFLTL